MEFFWWLIGILGFLGVVCLFGGKWGFGLLLIFIAAVIFCVLMEIEEDEAKRKKEKIKQTGFFTIEYRGKRTAGVVETFALLNEITKSPFSIDTSIWMGCSDLKCLWDQLVYCCQKNQNKIIIPAAVYDTIVNRAKNSNDDARYWAIKATQLLLELDNKNLLFIYNLDVNRNEYSDADPVLIQVCKAIIGNNLFCYLLTNDMDLTIRARHIINDNEERCKVLGVHETEFSHNEAEFYIPEIEQ